MANELMTKVKELVKTVKQIKNVALSKFLVIALLTSSRTKLPSNVALLKTAA